MACGRTLGRPRPTSGSGGLSELLLERAGRQQVWRDVSWTDDNWQTHAVKCGRREAPRAALRGHVLFNHVCDLNL